MLLVRCKDQNGQMVLTADRYTWNWIRFRKTDDGHEELPDGQPIQEGDYQGVGLSVRSDGEWESCFVSPDGYGQIIIEDEQRRTRDNFRLKKYSEKDGLVTC